MAPPIPGDPIPAPGAPAANTGDRLRLADTALILEVERDLTRNGTAVTGGGVDGGALDTVITNALILDWWGIVKADVGLRDGRIAAIGTVNSSGAEVIAGEGHILTAGSIDTHLPLLCPQQLETALASGVTTLLGGGSTGAFQLARMLQAAEGLPLNLGFYGLGNAGTPEAIAEQIRAGVPSGRPVASSRETDAAPRRSPSGRHAAGRRAPQPARRCRERCPMPRIGGCGPTTIGSALTSGGPTTRSAWTPG